MKKLLLFVLLVISSNVNAVVESCPGKVIMILDFPVKCSGRMGYKLDVTGTRWLCSLSKNGDSMILTAYTTGKTIDARLALPTPGACASITQYQLPSYIRMY